MNRHSLCSMVCATLIVFRGAMKHFCRPRPLILLATLGSLVFAGLAEGRVRYLDAARFLFDSGKGHYAFYMQGKQFIFEEDSSRTEAAFAFKAGLSEHWSLYMSLPYMMEARGTMNKNGQGDVAASIDWHNDLQILPGTTIGMRETVSIPSGYRKVLPGFPAWTKERVEWETTAHLEYGGSDPVLFPVWLSAYGGVRTDDHLENTATLWGAALRVNMFKRLLFFESEFGQEIRTGDKSSSSRLSTGVGLRLPLGFELRAGAEQRLLYGLDRLGVYAGLAWTRQPVPTIRLRNRYLREPVLQKLKQKNAVPGFTLEPGTPELFQDGGRLPYLPLKVAILPAGGNEQKITAELMESMKQAIEADTSFQVIAPEQVDRAMSDLHLSSERSSNWVNLLGLHLQADYILSWNLSSYDPWRIHSWRLPGILTKSRAESTLTGRIRLHEVEGSQPPLLAELGASAVGSSRLRWFQVEPHRVGQPDAIERNRMNRELLERWGSDARERLFYEISEQVIIP